MRKGGLAIIIFLIVALLVAYLLMTNMSGRKTGPADSPAQNHETLEQMAKDAVEKINENTQKSGLTDQTN